jgi:hypothetical protein
MDTTYYNGLKCKVFNISTAEEAWVEGKLSINSNANVGFPGPLFKRLWCTQKYFKIQMITVVPTHNADYTKVHYVSNSKSYVQFWCISRHNHEHY